MKMVIRTARYDTGQGKPVFEKGKFSKEDIERRGYDLAREHGVKAADIKISVTFTGSAQVFIDREESNEGDNAEVLPEVFQKDAGV